MSTPRFGAQADHYRRYRPQYPDWLFDRLVEACGAPLSHAADLGAGSGQATAPLLSRFDRVTAVEPDADMAALITADPRLTVAVGKAEEATFDTPLDAAISATALHWMDVEAVSEQLVGALRPHGAFLAFGYLPFTVAGTLGDVFRAEAALWEPFMHPMMPQFRDYTDLLTGTALWSDVERFSFEIHQPMSSFDLAGLIMSTSYANAYGRSLGDVDAYAADMTARLMSMGEQMSMVTFPSTAALARL